MAKRLLMMADRSSFRFSHLHAAVREARLENSVERVFLHNRGGFCPYFVFVRPPVFTALEIVPSALWAVWWQVKTQLLLLRL
jgi:hypothetical protein